MTENDLFLRLEAIKKQGDIIAERRRSENECYRKELLHAVHDNVADQVLVYLRLYEQGFFRLFGGQGL